MRVTCQSGVWAKAQGSSGTGLTGMLAPMKGRTISCNGYSGGTLAVTGQSTLDNTGQIYTRCIKATYFAPGDSGMVLGTNAQNTAGVYDCFSKTSATGLYAYILYNDGSLVAQCSSDWPLN